MKNAIIVIIAVTLMSVPCSANLVVKMTSDNTTLGVGDTALVRVWAFADDPSATGDNGLVSWQMDIDVDLSGILEITDNTFVAPDPLDMFDSDWNYDPGTGDLKTHALKSDDNTSAIGVDEFTEIYNFEITALAAGTVEYTIGNTLGGSFVGELVDFTFFDHDLGTAVFDVANSDNVFTVTPEPATVMMLGIGGLVFIRKK